MSVSLAPSAQEQRDSRHAFDVEAVTAGWTVVVSGDLIERRMSTGRLAAIWRYVDHTGADVFKLFTDRDNGDYVALEFAVAAAVVVESLGAVRVSL